MQNRFIKITIAIFTVLIILATIHYFWSGSFIKRYDSWLFFITFNLTASALSIAVYFHSIKHSLKWFLLWGVSLGYLLCIPVHILIESVLIPYSFNNLVNMLDRDLVSASQGILLFSLIIGGWLNGGIWGIALYTIKKT